ncbi:MAG: response regulator transcription factor, partial [Melioribacteraceae bacterium]|nr:response regulator transcription factor [Melioribacteraceae bacterium]
MKNKPKILLVEDDPNLGVLLKEFLEVKDFEVTLEVNGELGLVEFKNSAFDLLLLDIMMPKKDGFTLAKKIREIDGSIPIIFLSAKSLQVDKIEGFKIGADDYITKPFSMEELLYRISAILKRVDASRESNHSGVLKVGKFSYEFSKRTLTINNSVSKLTSKENELLNLLLEKRGEMLPRSEALLKIWKTDSYFNSRSMDVYISKLRGHFNKDNSI